MIKIKAWMQALRLHQWLKNLLIFVPLIAAHQAFAPNFLATGFFAFICFGLCASSAYILNDLLDLQNDRHHPSKQYRPFAANKLTIQSGIVSCILLLILSLTGSLTLLPFYFTIILVGYFLLTLCYSLWLRQLVMIDVIVLAILYTTRIFAGSVIFKIHPTFWLLAFSMFIFLSLALTKRYAELRWIRNNEMAQKSRGRGYHPNDLEMIASLGASSGYLSVLVLALYIQDPATTRLYQHSQFIWLACPLLLYWISRTWLLTHRGQMHEDPIIFATRDYVSLGVGLLFILVFWIAT